MPKVNLLMMPGYITDVRVGGLPGTDSKGKRLLVITLTFEHAFNDMEVQMAIPPDNASEVIAWLAESLKELDPNAAAPNN